MLKYFYPRYFCDSIFDIDLEKLKQEGVKALILDLDNTIIARNSSIATVELKSWLEQVRDTGIKACILSNNWKQRVQFIAEQLNLPIVARAAKPRKGAFKRALAVLGTKKEETIVIGDQIFTDVLGANLMGLKSILVLPMSNHEAFHTYFLRYLEKWILKYWQKHKKTSNIHSLNIRAGSSQNENA